VEFLGLITVRTDALKADFTGWLAGFRGHHARLMSLLGTVARRGPLDVRRRA
jgi:hypothetical protein